MQSLLPTPPSSQPPSASIAALEPPKGMTKASNEDEADAAVHNGTDRERRNSPDDTDIDTGRSQEQQQREGQIAKSSSPTVSATDSTSNPSAPAPSSLSTMTSLQQNSKAATIEGAIEYIKVLKREARERDLLLEKREIKVQELQVRLEEAERRRLNGLQQGEEAEDRMEMSDDSIVKTDMVQHKSGVEASNLDALFNGDDMVAT